MGIVVDPGHRNNADRLGGSNQVDYCRKVISVVAGVDADEIKSCISG